jgi:hypothetical protein
MSLHSVKSRRIVNEEALCVVSSFVKMLCEFMNKGVDGSSVHLLGR